MYRVLLTKKASKDLQRAPAHVKERAIQAIDALQESFAPVKEYDVKRLVGMEGAFRIRLGDWRILYEVKKSDYLIVIHRIIPRSKAYS